MSPGSYWRSFDADAGEPRPVGEALDRLSRRLGAPPSDALRSVFGDWAALVGDDVAAHCQPRSLHDGTLVVVADHPAWATSLRHLSADLVERVSVAVGAGVVRRLEVRVGDRS